MKDYARAKAVRCAVGMISVDIVFVHALKGSGQDCRKAFHS